jgi:predicted porin
MKNQFKIYSAIFVLFSSNINAASSNSQKHINDLSEQTTRSKSSFDFIKADSPFKYDFNIAGQPINIQLYGVIDIARARTNHSLPTNYELPNNLYPYAGAKLNPAVKSRSDWVNGGLQDSRLGLKGEFGKFKITDNTFKFIYQFEAGFNPIDMRLNNAAETLAENSGTNSNSSLSADSSLNGELFARQAWAGIDVGNVGRLTYGTQYNPFFEIFAAYDPNSKADTFSPFGESGTVGGGGGISENARMKNSIKYANSFDTSDHAKVNYGVMYEFGNAAGVGHGHAVTAQLGYETSLIGIQFAYNEFIDSVKVGTAGIGNPLANNTISASLFNTDAALITLKWMPTKDLKISGGWEWYQLKPSSSSSISYDNIFDQDVFGGVAISGLKPGFKQDNNVYFIGANFDFAERLPKLSGLSSSIGFYETKFDAIDGPTPSTNSQGNIDTWTFVADYKFNKRFDTYFAYTNNHFSGDKYPTATNYADVNTVGAGLRMRF